MNGRGRIDWRLCWRQAVLYPLAAMPFSASDLVRVMSQELASFHAALVLAEAYLGWFVAGLLLAATAQWIHAAPGRGLWRGVLAVAVAATVNGPVNEMTVRRFLFLVKPAPTFSVSPSIYLLWQGMLCGGLFFGYCLLVQRSRDRHGLLASAEIERANTEIRLRETQTQALEQRIDPALLERSLGALRAAYTQDRAAGEDMLGALVEDLRERLETHKGKST